MDCGVPHSHNRAAWARSGGLAPVPNLTTRDFADFGKSHRAGTSVPQTVTAVQPPRDARVGLRLRF